MLAQIFWHKGCKIGDRILLTVANVDKNVISEINDFKFSS
jgi:hypothetical protein